MHIYQVRAPAKIEDLMRRKSSLLCSIITEKAATPAVWVVLLHDPIIALGQKAWIICRKMESF